VALVGPNGAVKRTLLKSIVGLAPTVRGSVRIFSGSADGCRHRVAWLPQQCEIDWSYSVTAMELVLIERYVHLGWFRQPGSADLQLSRESLLSLGVGSLESAQIGGLSGGQKQRLLLTQALVQQADVFLLDEPLRAVDKFTRQVLE